MGTPLFYSFIIGFLAASPIGPIGLLCMRRVFVQGISAGMISALGISCAYSFWAYVTIHGLATFSNWIEREHQPLEIAIGLFFVLYGLNAIFNSPNIEYPTLKNKDNLTQFFSMFLVVFLNPATFIIFTVFFTFFGIAKAHFDFINSLELALCVFLGTMTFWMIASYTIHRNKSRIEDLFFTKIARISEFGILAFGMTILLYAIMDSF
jgi:putative LysE/RhtB family amino acid efflux pump